MRTPTPASVARIYAWALAGLVLATPAWAQNGTVTGRVTSAATGAPLAGVDVRLCQQQFASYSCLAPATTNTSGLYAVSAPPATYYAYTRNTLYYVDEIYDGLPCAFGCAEWTVVATGAPIVVSAGQTAAARDFALEPGGSISGAVTDAATGAALTGVRVYVYLLNQGSGSVTTDAAGRYVVAGLATGQYYAATTNVLGYTNEAFDNILLKDWRGPTSASMGHPIAVTTRTHTTGIDFTLDLGGRIAGVVTDARTSASVQGVVCAIDEADGFVPFATIGPSGEYAITGLPAGRYFVATATDHSDEIHDGIPWNGYCRSPDIRQAGTPVTVALRSTTPVDFSLEPAGAISGRVTEAATGQPLAGHWVDVFTPVAGQLFQAANAFTDASGEYRIDGLGIGVYHAVTQKHSDWIAELNGDIPCPGWSCDIAGSPPIVVTSAATTTGIDFALDLGGSISGTVTDAVTSAPLSTGDIAVFRSAGGTMALVSEVDDPTAGQYVVKGLPTGNYFVSTRFSRYLNEVFDDVACVEGTCAPEVIAAGGTPVPVTAGGTVTTGIDFALQPRTDPPGAPTNLQAVTDAFTVLLTWWPPAVGGAVDAYVLEAGLAPGATAWSGTLPPGLGYAASGIGPGRYYARVRARNAFGIGPPSAEREVIVNADGSGPMEPPERVSAWLSGRRLTLTWEPPASGGVPRGYIVEAGTAAGLRNIGALLVTARAFTYEGVPDGFYFLRVRAVRGPSTSRPSTEVMLNVGDVPAPPGAPEGLVSAVSGTTVTLTWVAPTGPAPTSYVVEAGSGPGLANLARVDTASAATTIAFAGIPPGAYYVRVRGVNALGAGVSSNEVLVAVVQGAP